jgi:Na+-translocating ferredoxin:NAD+ oxidoreductase RnfC subunit
MIKDCLRCGKCKPVCSTHVPRANLLYSPRNKILATSLLIEAFLYEEQTRRGVSLRISTSSTTSPTTARSATSA